MEKKLFQPRSDRPMQVAVFGSGTGTILQAMLAAQKSASTSFSIRLLYTDRECRFQKIAAEENLPLLYHPWKAPREEYDRQGLELLHSFPFEIDFLLLAGYMRLMSPVWLSAFKHRILNIHPADLTVLDAQGKRKYIGAEAVFAALQSGEMRTRSTAILIDEQVDGGPVLVSGAWVPYEGEYPVTQERATEHQTKQKAKSDWPACLAALQLIGEGRISLDTKTGQVFLDGKKLPNCGYAIGETTCVGY